MNPDAVIVPEDLDGFPVTYSQIDGGELMSKMWDSVGESMTESERERENGRQSWREDRRGNGKVRGRENGGESGIEKGNEREAGMGREDGMESESASFSTALDLYLERGGKQSNIQTSTTNTQVHLNHNTEDRTVGVGSRGQVVSGIPYKDRIEEGNRGGIGGGGTEHPVIQNRIVHYGVYCGPGPADAFSGMIWLYYADICVCLIADASLSI